MWKWIMAEKAAILNLIKSNFFNDLKSHILSYSNGLAI